MEQHISFAGTMAECLVHLSHSSAERAHEIEAALADFAAVEPKTARSWFFGDAIPKGSRKVLLVTFLQCAGYEVQEYTQLDPKTKKLFELVGFGVYDLEKLAEELRYGSGDSLLRILWGNSQLSAKKVSHLEAVLRGGADMELRSAKQVCEERVASVCRGAVTQTGMVPGGTCLPDDSIAVKALAAQIHGMIPLAEHMISDKCSDKERELLRDTIPNDGLMRLSTILNGLCSRSAREEVIRQLKKEEEKNATR